MRRIYFLIMVASIFLFTGCFDIIERYQLKEDGSGVYTMELNMSRALDMFGSMITASLAAEGIQNDSPITGGKKTVDSLYLFKDFVDTASDLTIEEKKVLRKGYGRMYINEGETKEGYISISYPFTDNAELMIIQQAMEKKKFLGEKDGEAKKLLSEGDMGKLFGSSTTARYNFYLSATGIERKFIGTDSSWIVLNPPDEVDEEDENMAALFSSVSKISAKTILELPRPVKNYQSNGKVTVSDDKRKITIIHMKTDATVLKPLDFAYKVDY
jgi:hypothetical protein